MLKKYFGALLIVIIGIMLASCKENQEVRVPPSSANSPGPVGEAISVNIDKSPLDLSYYPDEYPKLKMSGQAKEPVVARVIYSRPKKEGRIIFGNVLKYGARWRLGANEASEIEFFKDVMIQKTQVKQNRYIIYCIPYEDKWTVIFNSDLFTWGLKIDSSKDVYKFDIPVSKTQYPMEYFTMGFEKTDSSVNLVMSWDAVKTTLPFSY